MPSIWIYVLDKTKSEAPQPHYYNKTLRSDTIATVYAQTTQAFIFISRCFEYPQAQLSCHP